MAIFFQQKYWHILILLGISGFIQAQENFTWNCITSPKDTTVFYSKIDAEQYMKDQLDNALKKSKATAHWQLTQLDTLHHFVNYTFYPGNTIRKGKLKGVDTSIIQEETLSQLLFWKTNTPYNSIQINNRLINELKNKGLNLTYHQVFFSDSIVDLRIKIEKIARNQFQGLLGTINQDNKTILIGEVKAQWVNNLKRAEKLFFHWQRQSISTQRFEGEINFPVVFKSPFGIQQSIEMYRNQNIFFIVGARGAVNYRTTNGSIIQAKYETKNHNALIQSQTIQHRLFGLGVIQNSSEFKDFTYSLNFGFLRGFKNTIDLEGEQRAPLIKTELDLRIERNSKLFFSSLAIHQRGIYLQKDLAQIEKNRVGGVETIRGFGQESIFCSRYLGSQFETGWNYNSFGRFFLFYDQGWIQSTTSPAAYWQGIGFGGLFNVPDGQIEISSGWGIPNGQKVELRNNLIHIQYQVFF